MGRTSKFLFPMPGRRHTTRENVPTPNTASTSLGSHLSKAHRILGTESQLNIDSPAREKFDDYSWGRAGSRASGMSISISESTQSTNEDSSVHSSDQWDRESGVLPHGYGLSGKPSSTLLSQHFGEDRTTVTSGGSTRLRHNDSSSTLKSHYDRQKSPLSISQQTSASSARDLALRKGFPPVLRRSPLLQIESSMERFFEDSFVEKDVYIKEEGAAMPEKMRKKPARLDLSMLFPRSRKHNEKSTANPTSSDASPSSMSTNNPRNSTQPPNSSQKKLRKAPSKESILSHQTSIRTTRSHDKQARQVSDMTHNLYDHYQNLPFRSPHMDRIPEASVPERLAARGTEDGHGHSKLEVPSRSPSTSERSREYLGQQPFSWKNVRSSMMPSPQENSSAASISSRNTKTSRHSVLSQSNLKDKSVLSLSSDSDGDSSDQEPVRSPSVSSKNNRRISLDPSQSAHLHTDRRQSLHQPGGLTARTQRKGAAKEATSLIVPETTTHSLYLSGTGPKSRTENYAPVQPKEHRVAVKKEKRTSKQPSSINSGRSPQQPAPQLSPALMELRQPEQSSRYMAVTKQEEALLEALRQKRARMREEIIEEHETSKTPSPPRIPERSASRYQSTTNTSRGSGTAHGKQRVLLYLDSPLSASQAVDTSESSPDLSDFLSFGSDENSTPRNSWAPPLNDKTRPNSLVSPDMGADHFSPATPPSAARLSAVGINRNLSNNKKRNTAGVRFVDDSQVNAQDFLLDDAESGVIWGM